MKKVIFSVEISMWVVSFMCYVCDWHKYPMTIWIPVNAWCVIDGPDSVRSPSCHVSSVFSGHLPREEGSLELGYQRYHSTSTHGVLQNLWLLFTSWVQSSAETFFYASIKAMSFSLQGSTGLPLLYLPPPAPQSLPHFPCVMTPLYMDLQNFNSDWVSWLGLL